MSHTIQGHPRWTGHGGEYTGEGNGKPLQYSNIENSRNCMKGKKIRHRKKSQSGNDVKLPGDENKIQCC